MKKFIAVVCAALMCVCFASCQKTEQNEETASKYLDQLQSIQSSLVNAAENVQSDINKANSEYRENAGSVVESAANVVSEAVDNYESVVNNVMSDLGIESEITLPLLPLD